MLIPRIGFGYDAHKLKEGRRMILCGVTVPCTFGPLGHSDADVPVHALIDAILGALALGDIGMHFPPSDEQYKDISSMILLARTVDLMQQQGYDIGNIDITIVLQKPKLAAYINEMRNSLVAVLHCDISQVSVKATTEEYMGFTGSGEGIAAYAAVMLSSMTV